MIGDKIHNDRSDPGFSRRMRVALESTPGLVWHGGHPRAEAMRVTVAAATSGCRWRHPELDASLELSTKVLEIGAARAAGRAQPHARCTRTCSARTIRCSPTPEDDVSMRSRRSTDRATYACARSRCLEAARGFTLERGGRPAPHLPRRGASRPHRRSPGGASAADRGRRARPEVLHPAAGPPPVAARAWRSASTRGRRSSRTTPSRVASWPPGPTSSSASGAARTPSGTAMAQAAPDQRLVVRLHRFELYGAWPERLDIDAVDQVDLRQPALRAS